MATTTTKPKPDPTAVVRELEADLAAARADQAEQAQRAAGTVERP